MRMCIARIIQCSYLCRQSLCDTAIDAVQWGGTAFHSMSLLANTQLQHVWEPRDGEINSVPQASREPLEGEPALNTAWDIMGVNRYQMDPDALCDTAEQSIWNNQPVLFCLGSLSNISSEICLRDIWKSMKRQRATGTKGKNKVFKWGSVFFFL